MLPDPVTIAANAPTPSLVLSVTRSDGYGSERVDTGGNGYYLTINHTPGKNSNRHYIKMVQKQDAVNPYSGLTVPQEASVSLSISAPTFGFTDAALAALVQSLFDTVLDGEVTTLALLQNQS